MSPETVGELPDTLRLVAELGASMWSLSFLVPTGRASCLSALAAAQTEDVLAFLAEATAVITLKTTEAPAYRRVVYEGRGATRSPSERGPLYAELHDRLERLAPELRASGDSAARGTPRRRPLAVDDGRGVVFVSHRGDVRPGGFLPVVVGNVREAPLSAIYTGAPLLRALRDPSLLGGRCGLAKACGGPRPCVRILWRPPRRGPPTCTYEPPPR